MKNFGERERGRIQGLPNFLSTPIIPGTGKATNFKFGRCIQSIHAKKSPLKIWEKWESGRILGLPKYFSVPSITSGTGKATNFQFCTDVLSIHQNKAHYKFQEK